LSSAFPTTFEKRVRHIFERKKKREGVFGLNEGEGRAYRFLVPE